MMSLGFRVWGFGVGGLLVAGADYQGWKHGQQE